MTENNKLKIAFITGAGRGIGRATALHFAKEGYIVVLNARSENELNEAVQEIRDLGLKAFMLQGDISEMDTVKNAFGLLETIAREYSTEGVIDVLINNAGIAHIGLLQDMSVEEWNHIVAVNLGSVFNTCHEAIPYMLRQGGGRIINISSVWGISGASCEVAYSATKGGVNAFTRALAKELAPSNISVNAIACGAIDTSMNGQLDEDEKKCLNDEIPMGRMGTPEEVAKLCLKLAEMPHYLTGEVIKLDGAWI